MRKEAEEHAGEDERKKSLVEARNKADHAIYEIDKLLKEHGEKVDASAREAIEAQKKAVEDAKAGEDAPAIETAIEALMTASQEIAKKVYAEQAAAQGAPAGAPGTEPPPEPAAAEAEEKVIDADFEVKP
jgi:molecular chaperone DnaK